MTPDTKAAMLAYADDQFTQLEFRPVGANDNWTRLTGDPVWNHRVYEYRVIDLRDKRVHPHARTIIALASHPDLKLEVFDPNNPRIGWMAIDSPSTHAVELYRHLEYRIVEPS